MQALTGKKLRSDGVRNVSGAGESKLTTASPPVENGIPAVENVAITAAGMLIPISKRLGTGLQQRFKNKAFGSGYHLGRGDALRPRGGASRLIPIGAIPVHSERGTRGECQVCSSAIDVQSKSQMLADPTWNTHVSLSPMGRGAIRSAREAKDRAGHFLEIGKSPDVDPVLVEVLYSIRLPLYSDLEISIHSEPSSDLAHGLMSADLDVALITQPERNAKLTMTKLAETPLHIVLPREHTLATKSAIKLADLRDERWIIYQQRTHPLLYERLMKLMRDEHIHPKHIDRILYPDEAEHLLMGSRGVALLTKASALKLDGKRLVAKPLEEDALCLDEWIAARGDDNSRLVSEFVRAFVTRSTIVLQPSQMILPIGKNGSLSATCSSS